MDKDQATRMKEFQMKLSEQLSAHIRNILANKSTGSLVSIAQIVKNKVEELYASGYLKKDEPEPKFDYQVQQGKMLAIIPLNLQAQRVLNLVYGKQSAPQK